MDVLSQDVELDQDFAMIEKHSLGEPAFSNLSALSICQPPHL